MLYIHYIVSVVPFFSLHPLITVVLIRVSALLPSTRNLQLYGLDVEKTVAGVCEAMPVSEVCSYCCYLEPLLLQYREDQQPITWKQIGYSLLSVLFLIPDKP